MKGVDYSKDESEELRRLRRQVAEQEEEIKFLKKATVGSIGQCNMYHNRLNCCGDPNEPNLHRRRERTCF